MGTRTFRRIGSRGRVIGITWPGWIEVVSSSNASSGLFFPSCPQRSSKRYFPSVGIFLQLIYFMRICVWLCLGDPSTGAQRCLQATRVSSTVAKKKKNTYNSAIIMSWKEKEKKKLLLDKFGESSHQRIYFSSSLRTMILFMKIKKSASPVKQTLWFSSYSIISEFLFF